MGCVLARTLLSRTFPPPPLSPLLFSLRGATRCGSVRRWPCRRLTLCEVPANLDRQPLRTKELAGVFSGPSSSPCRTSTKNQRRRQRGEEAFPGGRRSIKSAGSPEGGPARSSTLPPPSLSPLRGLLDMPPTSKHRSRGSRTSYKYGFTTRRPLSFQSGMGFPPSLSRRADLRDEERAGWMPTQPEGDSLLLFSPPLPPTWGGEDRRSNYKDIPLHEAADRQGKTWTTYRSLSLQHFDKLGTPRPKGSPRQASATSTTRRSSTNSLRAAPFSEGSHFTTWKRRSASTPI